MLFMVIERFRDNDMVPIYRRVRGHAASALGYQTDSSSKPPAPLPRSRRTTTRTADLTWVALYQRGVGCRTDQASSTEGKLCP